MRKHPYLKCKINGTHHFLLKDWQDFMGWVVLIISNSDTITKADKRIKGDANIAEAKFKELYGYRADFSHKSLKEVL